MLALSFRWNRSSTLYDIVLGWQLSFGEMFVGIESEHVLSERRTDTDRIAVRIKVQRSLQGDYLKL